MKFILPFLLITVVPLAAQTNDTSASVNPADSEPVIHAPPAPTKPDYVPPPVETVSLAPQLSPDPFSESLIAQIVVRYQKAWEGDKKETKALTTDLERWTKDEPNNYMLLAYLGSVYALDSRDAWIGPGKISFLKKGDKALDAAVEGDSSNPAVRLLRAMNYYELPAMFGKHQAAHDDFQILLQQLAGKLPMPYQLQTDTQQAIYYYAGLSDIQFDQRVDAKEVLQRGLQLDPKSKLGVKIQAELAKLK